VTATNVPTSTSATTPTRSFHLAADGRTEVLSGMWEMNMEHIPLAAHPHAFWWMFGIQLAVGVVLLVILRLWKLL
jgi:hypothetical protein